MDISYFDTFLSQIQIMPLVLAIAAAALGLILWGAGIKAAKVVAALVAGVVCAVVCMAIFTPLKFAGLSALAGVGGLAIGAVTAIMAFEMVQGLGLGIVLALVLCISYCRWQTETVASLAAHNTVEIRTVSTGTPAQAGAAKAAAARPAAPFTAMPQSFVEGSRQWSAVPQPLRQRMSILGVAVILAMLGISIYLPKSVTWTATAIGGALLVIYGTQMLLHIYKPSIEHGIRFGPLAQLGLLAAFVLLGMLIQRFVFWPKRGDGKLGDKALAASLRPI